MWEAILYLALFLGAIIWGVVWLSRKLMEAQSGFCSTDPELNESRYDRYESRVNEYVAGMDDSDADEFNLEFEQRRLRGIQYKQRFKEVG